MRIQIVTPARPGTRTGNRVTALRWAGLLRSLGHRVTVGDGEGDADVLIAVHARKSHAAVVRFLDRWPDRPVIVLLSGTDLYQDTPEDEQVAHSLERATRVVTLQPLAAEALPASIRPKVRVVTQSATASPSAPRRDDVFEVCVAAHLRAVKDPLLAARASHRVPSRSRLRLLHLGGVLDAELEQEARTEQARNPRYRWLGDVRHARAKALLSRCRAVVVSSRSEGGSNVVSEAVVAGVPILATDIPGTVGLLGEGYPGLFPCGGEAALAALLQRIEDDPEFLGELGRWCDELRPGFHPDREREAWRHILAGL